MPNDAVVLGAAQYGKAEVRLLHVDRRRPDHRITDLNVTITLAGDQADTYLTGDNAKVLTTDAQKNTVYAFAREQWAAAPEEFGLRLARHFAAVPSVSRAQVRIERYGWRPVAAGGAPHPHSFERLAGTRIASACVHGDGRAEVVAGVGDLILLKSSGSEFEGFLEDRYTTLEPTKDRILATAVDARWRLAAGDAGWDAAFAGARAALAEAFAVTHSRSLQQTLYAMGAAVLAACPQVCEARLSLPNRHHFLVDLSPFGLDNPGEVFYAADRPYGLIEGTVAREGAPAGDPEHQW
ncbi:MAG TPA: urate oxidase [Streptosporangiaceae bacterium]